LSVGVHSHNVVVNSHNQFLLELFVFGILAIFPRWENIERFCLLILLSTVCPITLMFFTIFLKKKSKLSLLIFSLTII